MTISPLPYTCGQVSRSLWRFMSLFSTVLNFSFSVFSQLPSKLTFSVSRCLGGFGTWCACFVPPPVKPALRTRLHQLSRRQTLTRSRNEMNRIKLTPTMDKRGRGREKGHSLSTAICYIHCRLLLTKPRPDRFVCLKMNLFIFKWQQPL